MKKLFLLVLFITVSGHTQSIKDYFKVAGNNIVKEFSNDKGETIKIHVTTLKNNPLEVAYEFFKDGSIISKGTETYQKNTFNITASEIFLTLNNKKISQKGSIQKIDEKQNEKGAYTYSFLLTYTYEKLITEITMDIKMSFHKKDKDFNQKYLKVVVDQKGVIKNDSKLPYKFSSKTSRIYYKNKGLVAFVQNSDGKTSDYKLIKEYVKK